MRPFGLAAHTAIRARGERLAAHTAISRLRAACYDLIMIHETLFKIRTYHTDAFGHVNNSKYLELLEEARWQFAEHIGLIPLLTENNLGFIIIDMNVRFRVPVFERDTIQVFTSLITLGSASGDVRQLVHKQGSKQVSLKAMYHFILIDRNTGRSVPIESEIRELLLNIIESG
jgi:thioesterase-3